MVIYLRSDPFSAAPSTAAAAAPSTDPFFGGSSDPFAASSDPFGAPAASVPPSTSTAQQPQLDAFGFPIAAGTNTTSGSSNASSGSVNLLDF